MTSSNREFVVISARTIQRLLNDDWGECIRIVRTAYQDHAAGKTINPQSVFLRFPERPTARIIALPSHLKGEDEISGIKWVASYPENTLRELKRASAILILNDAATGYPLACLEGSVISATRTAASAVLAAEYLRPGRKSFATLGIVGTGEIARYVLNFLQKTSWHIDAVHLYDMNSVASSRFGGWICNTYPQLRVNEDTSAESIISSSDVTIFTTSAGSPYVSPDVEVSKDKTILHLSLRDLPPEMVARSNNIVDDPHHALTANTSLALAEQQLGHRNFVTGTLAELISGTCHLDENRPAIFSPFGLGMLDLAVGRWIYQRSVKEGDVSAIPEFFP